MYQPSVLQPAEPCVTYAQIRTQLEYDSCQRSFHRSERMCLVCCIGLNLIQGHSRLNQAFVQHRQDCRTV